MMEKNSQFEWVNFRKSCSIFQHFSQEIFRCGYIQEGNLESVLKLKNFYQINCNIDLRSEKEVQDTVLSSLLKQSGIHWIHFPLSLTESRFRKVRFPTPYDYYLHYVELIENNKGTLKKIFDFLAEKHQGNLLISCLAGKDRTGILCALLMSILDVPETVIVNDYALSAEGLPRHISKFKPYWEKKELTEAEFKPRLKPHPVSMELFLMHIKDHYGSVLLFLNNMGVTERSIAKIQNKFLQYPIHLKPEFWI